MAGFFKNIFGSRPNAAGRSLQHPRDLRRDDLLRFGTLETQALSGGRFRVTDVNTYLLGNERLPKLTLTGDDGSVVYFSLDLRDGAALFSVSGRLQRSEVARLFKLEEFARLFEDKEEALSLSRVEEPPSMAGWTAPLYHLQIDALKGIFHKGDYRGNAFFPRPQEGEGMDYYLLVDNRAIHTIEVEVYDGGETEVYVSRRFPISKIEEMWPGSSG
ncbi:MAG: hypothetical protein HQL64_08415 [Magnetococcales bacterium]|nr:hypothetical protein [Magnetococcales bacterium]